MGFPVTISETPLVFDALPAIKVRHYHGESRRGKVYSYARLYLRRHAMELSLCAFERSPDPQSLVEFALATGPGRILLLSLSPQKAALRLCGEAEKELAAPPPAYFSGDDEQGWYWGAQLSLPAAQLAEAGLRPQQGQGFSAAVFKARQDEEAFGASFPPAGQKLDYERFPIFTAVGY